MSTTVRYWFDTEFMEDGKSIELLSIGIVCEDGREFYAVSADADRSRANEWVVENVFPHLGNETSPRHTIAADLLDFVAAGNGKPEFWAYYGDYDWVVLCQLYGRMIDLPDGWPMFALDVKQEAHRLGNPQLPEQTSTEHNALADARWTRDAWKYLHILDWKIATTDEQAMGALPPPGVCPHCGRWIGDHDSDERKTCHDACSGYQR